MVLLLLMLLKLEKLLILWFKITDKDLQKEIYFNPSVLRSSEELQWLRQGTSEVLWVFQASDAGMVAAEDMMIHKLIMHPKLLNDQPERYNILRFSGVERLHIIRKWLDVRKVVLLGVTPAAFGIHIPCPSYEIVSHAGIQFLSIDAPEQMPALPPATKSQLASVIKIFHES
jgi:hypothetical protein